MCLECAFEIEKIQIQDYKKSFFMKIFKNISISEKKVIEIKEIIGLNLT
jgi:hypothetical protein